MTPSSRRRASASPVLEGAGIMLRKTVQQGAVFLHSIRMIRISADCLVPGFPGHDAPADARYQALYKIFIFTRKGLLFGKTLV